MSLDENVSRLIGRIYDSVGDRAAWSGVLDTLAERTGSRFVMMSAVDLGTATYLDTSWHGPDDARFLDGIRDYDCDVHRDDPTLAFAIANPDARVIDLRTAIVRQGRDPGSDEFVHWVRDRLGADDTIVRYTAPTDGITLGVSLHVEAGAGRHAPDSVALFLMLFEHIERAVRIAVRPLGEDGDRAVIHVDRNGRIVHASVAAAALLDAGDGLRRVGNRLVAASAAQDKRLDAAIRSALGALSHGSAGGALSLPRPSGRADLLLRVDPMPRPLPPFGAFHPAATISLVEPDAADVGAQATRRWVQAFGLTPAETRLAAAMLTDEDGLRAVADRLGIAYATARVHLASIFEKTGVRSQAQLARLLTRLGAWAVTIGLAIGSGLDQMAGMIA